jgi:hypothetical protein
MARRPHGRTPPRGALPGRGRRPTGFRLIRNKIVLYSLIGSNRAQSICGKNSVVATDQWNSRTRSVMFSDAPSGTSIMFHAFQACALPLGHSGSGKIYCIALIKLFYSILTSSRRRSARIPDRRWDITIRGSRSVLVGRKPSRRSNR